MYYGTVTIRKWIPFDAVKQLKFHSIHKGPLNTELKTTLAFDIPLSFFKRSWLHFLKFNRQLDILVNICSLPFDDMLRRWQSLILGLLHKCTSYASLLNTWFLSILEVELFQWDYQSSSRNKFQMVNNCINFLLFNHLFMSLWAKFLISKPVLGFFFWGGKSYFFSI